MSGGIRTSVKSYLISQRISIPVTVHENESTNGNFTAPQHPQAADTEEQRSMDLDSSRFSGSIPCLPKLRFTSKTTVLNGTRIRAYAFQVELQSRVPNGTRRGESLPYREPSTPRTEEEVLLKIFSFDELKTATGNFRPDSLLGKGGFGSVFKGWIDESSLAAATLGTGVAVAIKRLGIKSMQGREEGFREIHSLGKLRHPSLVKLIGYCAESNEFLLVYEYLPLGSLEDHIYGRRSKLKPLSWTLRMKIALGAAKALAFLHNEAKIIHRDIKPANFLLDSTYNVKLADFGLAMDGRSLDRPPATERTRTNGYAASEHISTRVMGTNGYATSHISTRVMGTFGYLAPEYAATGHVNTKCDVYGFGVVLLQLLSGKRCIDIARPRGKIFLVEWAAPYAARKRKVHKLFDGRIRGQFSVASAREVAKLAFLCLSTDPRRRPEMNDVVESLEKLQESGDRHGWPSSGPTYSAREV